MTPEKENAEISLLLDEVNTFLVETKKFLKEYKADDSGNDYDSLHNDAILLAKYDKATENAVKVGMLIANAWINKSNLKKKKHEIMRLDIKTRSMLCTASANIESVLGEIDDIIQALIGFKSSIDSRARFFEKAQYIIYAQKTFL